MASDDFFGLVRAWLTVHLPRARRLSPHTIRSYKTALSTLLAYLRETRGLDLAEISFEAIDHAAISGFTLWLVEEDTSSLAMSPTCSEQIFFLCAAFSLAVYRSRPRWRHVHHAARLLRLRVLGVTGDNGIIPIIPNS